MENEKAFLEADRVWLVHRDGFAAAGLLKDEAGEGMVRVQLDYNGDIFDVEEDDVELANPPGFDKVEDLAQLRYVSKSKLVSCHVVLIFISFCRIPPPPSQKKNMTSNCGLLAHVLRKTGNLITWP